MQEKIYEILAAYLSGENISDKERDILNAWLNSNSTNVSIEGRLSNLVNDLNDFRKIGGIDLEKAYHKNFVLFNIRKKKVIRKLYTRLGYAASVIIVCVCSILFFTRDFNSEIKNKIVKVSDICSGSAKAILKLADGEVVNLDKYSETLLEDSISIIKCNNSVLEYSPKNKTIVVPKLTYNILTVPRGGEYQLLLEDGTKVYLNSDSKLKFPVRFGSKERKVWLEGEGYFEVTKDSSRPFVVKAGGMNIEVLGTSFNVSSYEEDINVYTTLVSGKVKVTDMYSTGKYCVLEPGKQAIYSKNTNLLKTKDVDIDLYTSWKDGYYKFENKSLDEIMKLMSRWYNIEVFYRNKDLKNINFSGRVKRYSNISEFIELLSLTNDVDFELRKGVVVIKNK